MDLGGLPGQASIEATMTELSHRPQSTPRQPKEAAASKPELPPKVKRYVVFHEGQNGAHVHVQ